MSGTDSPTSGIDLNPKKFSQYSTQEK